MAVTSLRWFVCVCCLVLCCNGLASRAVVKGDASCSSNQRWEQPYPMKGVAWDCLGHKMSVPFSDNYGCFEIRTGQFSCKDTHQTTADDGGNDWWFTRGLLVVLVLVHVSLLLLPIIGAYLVWRSEDDLETAGCSDTGQILVSMSLFALASFAEIAQHVMDNWILLGLIPTVYNAAFYGGLSLAQSILALGARNRPTGAIGLLGLTISIVSSLAAFVALMAGWSACSAGPLQAPQWAGCYGFSLVWIITFSALTVTALCFFTLTHSGFSWVPAAASYVIGLAGVISAINTGYQVLHALGALGFTFGFIFQLVYLLQLKAPSTAGVHKGHSD